MLGDNLIDGENDVLTIAVVSQTEIPALRNQFTQLE
jgi:hypothetical protein